MAWEARSGLKLSFHMVTSMRVSVGMAWEARSGLKPQIFLRLREFCINVGMAWEARSGLKFELALS